MISPENEYPQGRPRELTLEMLADKQLAHGDSIIGLAGKDEIDAFERAIGDSLSPHDTARHVSLTERYRLSEALRPTRFAGRLVDANALVLPGTHYDTTLNENGRQVGPTVQLLMTAMMRSTGRGIVGSTAAISTYTQNVSYGNGTDSDVRRRIKKARNITDAEALVDELIGESSIKYRELASLALRKTFSAGLPTLGKR